MYVLIYVTVKLQFVFVFPPVLAYFHVQIQVDLLSVDDAMGLEAWMGAGH